MGRCPICFLQNISLIRLVVLEKKIFEGLLPYLGMAAILNFGSKPFNKAISFPQCLDATYEIWLHLAQWFQRRSRLKVWTDDGQTTEASHTKSSPGAFGSGELKYPFSASLEHALFRKISGVTPPGIGPTQITHSVSFQRRTS